MSRIELDAESTRVIATVFQNKIKQKIVKLLLDEKKPIYHNQICKRVGGSKSTVHRHLVELINARILIPEPGYKSSKKKKLVELYSVNKEYLSLLQSCKTLL